MKEHDHDTHNLLPDQMELRMLEAHRFWITMKGNEVVPIQRDFPNCQTKYDSCCYDNRKFWEGLQGLVKVVKPRKQQFRITTPKLELGKQPEGFEGW